MVGGARGGGRGIGRGLGERGVFLVARGRKKHSFRACVCAPMRHNVRRAWSGMQGLGASVRKRVECELPFPSSPLPWRPEESLVTGSKDLRAELGGSALGVILVWLCDLCPCDHAIMSTQPSEPIFLTLRTATGNRTPTIFDHFCDYSKLVNFPPA